MDDPNIDGLVAHLGEHHLVEVPHGATVLSNEARTVMRHMNLPELDSLGVAARKQTAHGESHHPLQVRDAVLVEIDDAKQHVLPRPRVVLRPGTDAIPPDDVVKARDLAKKLGVAVVLVPADQTQEFCTAVTPKDVSYKKITNETRYGALNVSLDDALSAADGMVIGKGDAALLQHHEYVPHASRDLADRRMPRSSRLHRAYELARDKATVNMMDDVLLAANIDMSYRIGRRQDDYNRTLTPPERQPSRDFSR